MAGHWGDLFSFVTGSIRANDLAYLVLSNDASSVGKIPSAGIVQWEPSGWGDGGQVPWRAAGTAISSHPLEQLCVVGEFGEVLLLGGGDRHEERIGKGKNSPKNRGPIRGVRAVGNSVYCVGMDRQAYRRDGPKKWTLLGTGLPTVADDEVVGFEAVDGFSESNIYACGWEGEIWHFDGKVWSQRNSPVNTVLVDLCCAGDGYVYACARNGVLVRGLGHLWEVVDLGEFTDDIWSLAWFNGAIYVATMDYVFTLGLRGLELVKMGKEKVRTCYDLTVGGGMLWSIGAKDVVSFDGKIWSRVD